jgi:hypothetical protein
MGHPWIIKTKGICIRKDNFLRRKMYPHRRIEIIILTSYTFEIIVIKLDFNAIRSFIFNAKYSYTKNFLKNTQ